ncbi:transglutaminase-like domain-containing protein [Roseomonas rosulenta]|uniref:transglutaminase-like domain-containing protein n=1 Tax=Roseomonas rosulenta TaxID=2748667 RepID=UPI0018DF5C2C|nr:transglutaminase-like domain-containing protein [Roseomonas rosulenta]
MAGAPAPRRAVLAGAAVLGAGAAHAEWIAPAGLIDSDRPALRDLAQRLVAGLPDARARAVAIHRFVSREIAFGFRPTLWDMHASAVLEAGMGFCTSKSTLFVALLRAAGVPARQRFLDIPAEILAGILDPGTPRVDHAITEVLLDGAWIGVDSYTTDPPLFDRAVARLRAEGRVLGYGAHARGTTGWDGLRPAFCQLVDDGAPPDLTPRDHGVHADARAFVAAVPGAWNRLTLLARLVLPGAARAANRRIASLRAGPGVAAGAAPG